MSFGTGGRYPEPVYPGATGEMSATLRAASADPDLIYGNGTRAHYLMKGESTHGLFGLYRWEMTAEVTGPGPHFHRSITESFYVLSGAIRIYDGRRWLDTGVGDFVHVPEGGIHGFRNESGETASMLLLFAPGAPREGYFETLKALGEGLTMTEPEREAFYAAHDNIWL